MKTTNIVDFARRDKMTDALTELLRTGAQNLIAKAVEAELSGYLKRFAKYLNHLTLPEIIDFNALNDAQCLKFFAKRCSAIL